MDYMFKLIWFPGVPSINFSFQLTHIVIRIVRVASTMLIQNTPGFLKLLRILIDSNWILSSFNKLLMHSCLFGWILVGQQFQGQMTKTHYFGPWLLNIKMGKKKYFIDNMNQYNYCVNYVLSRHLSQAKCMMSYFSHDLSY